MTTFNKTGLFGPLYPMVLFVGVLVLFFGSACSALANQAAGAAPLPAELKNSIREVRVAGGQKLLALTFDLCEGARETSGFDRDLVDFLKTNSLKATFFAGGKWMRSHPEQTFELMLDPLFELGNHSWSHANFRMITPDEAREEVVRTGEQFFELRKALLKRLEADAAGAQRAARLQPSMKLFRFPYGTCTAESLELLAGLGMPAIQWNIVSGDPAPRQSPGAIVATVLPRAKPGSIIIFHANGKGHGTLRALRELVPVLRGRGFEFVTVSELLASGEPVAVPDCYELRPGDNMRYNRSAGVKKTRPAHGRGFSVALDIGHSRETPGALSARNRPEYVFNRKMALAVLRELNRVAGIRAFLINPDGDDITLRERAELINKKKPDLLISIHHDSVRPDYLSDWTRKGHTAQFCDNFWGYSVFISRDNAKQAASRSFALTLGAQMREAGFIPSTHHSEAVEGEGRQAVDAEKGVYRHDGLVVLKETKSPALLLECGIIKNRGEEMLLRSRAYRLRMARTVRSAVEIFAGGRK